MKEIKNMNLPEDFSKCGLAFNFDEIKNVMDLTYWIQSSTIAIHKHLAKYNVDIDNFDII